MVEYDLVESDVLVLGAGNAGLRAAVEASVRDANVTVLSKAPVPGGSSLVAGGIMQASFGWNEGDTPDAHFRDTVIGGDYLCDQKLVRILVDEAPKRILDLERFGVEFLRTSPTRYYQHKHGGSTVARSLFVGRNEEVLRVLMDEGSRRKVKIYDQCLATKLLTDKTGSVVGATAIDIERGNFHVFSARSVIVATGALGRIYKVTADTRSATGDGFALAWKVGAKLVNMEMIQYIPIAYAYPEFIKGMTLGEATSWGKNTRFINKYGERFITKYDHGGRFEYTTRDVCARANYQEILDGKGTENEAILIDITKNDPKDSFWASPHGAMGFRYRLLRDFYGSEAVQFKKPIEATPSALYVMGGIKIYDETCSTNIPGLYACGEACANIHGANRLGGNSLIETQVTGALAGRQAAECALSISPPRIDQTQITDEYDRVFHILESKEGIRPIKIRRSLQETMWRKVGVVKKGEDLEQALREIMLLKKNESPKVCLMGNTKRYNYEWVEALELQNMLDVAEMICRCALTRKESRGAHYRTDYPKRNNEDWLKETVVTRQSGEVTISTEPVRITELEPRDAKV